jgi:hypothetical protein
MFKSPPDKLAIFFQLFFGGLTLKTTPSEKGSKESTSSSSASPPNVIICSKFIKEAKLKLFLVHIYVARRKGNEDDTSSINYGGKRPIKCKV